MTAILSWFSFCLGACAASFLNVVVWRVPRGESVVAPPSHCPKCGHRLAAWQNVPVVSWLLLRGRCAWCRGPISPRYVLVELLGGALYLAAFLRADGLDCWTGWLQLAAVWIWMALMIAGSLIDCDHRLLPDFTTVGGMALGVATAAALSVGNWLEADGGHWLDYLRPLLRSLSGLAVGAGVMGAVRWLGSKAFGREAMGMGDVLLLGAVGAMFGPVAALATLMLSSVLGSAAGLAMMALAKARLGGFAEIPYGPYICLACLAWIFCGERMLDWYLRLFAQ